MVGPASRVCVSSKRESPTEFGINSFIGKAYEVINSRRTQTSALTLFDVGFFFLSYKPPPTNDGDHGHLFPETIPFRNPLTSILTVSGFDASIQGSGLVLRSFQSRPGWVNDLMNLLILHYDSPFSTNPQPGFRCESLPYSRV